MAAELSKNIPVPGQLAELGMDPDFLMPSVEFSLLCCAGHRCGGTGPWFTQAVLGSAVSSGSGTRLLNLHICFFQSSVDTSV